MDVRERIHSHVELASPSDRFRRSDVRDPTHPRDSLLSDPPAYSLAAAISGGPPPTPQQRESRSLVRAGHAPGRAPFVFLGGSHPLDYPVASDPRAVPSR